MNMDREVDEETKSKKEVLFRVEMSGCKKKGVGRE